jgi:membrane complex biogenesis BtpA family protein
MNASEKTASLFGRHKAIIGMIHVGALPGTPHSRYPVRDLVERAEVEARVLVAGGVDAVMIENMHDRPYLRQGAGPEIVSTMTVIGTAVRATVRVPVGVQVLAGANREALAVALAARCGFIRVENFAYAHVADEGLMSEADAGPLLRYRRVVGAEGIAVLADVKKKHSSHAITADVDLGEAAHTAEFFGADGVVITGIATGRPTAPADAQAASAAVNVPVLIGSGITPDNLPDLWPHADAFIVGSYLKHAGDWRNELDPWRIEMLMNAVAKLR